jgi:hypothetical protein
LSFPEKESSVAVFNESYHVSATRAARVQSQCDFRLVCDG